MGKQLHHDLHQQQTAHVTQFTGHSLFCQRCSTEFSSILNGFSFRCLFVLILSLSLLLSVIFWVLPRRTHLIDGFDADDSIKLSASVQAYLRLQMPVSELVPLIRRLEYNINDEIGVPSAKVTILSMHSTPASNWTDVVFAVLSDPINDPIPQVYLSVLRSSLIDVFLGESNLTLGSPFGQLSLFKILKFPGGITVVPVPYVSIWQFHHVFFSFSLNNSIAEVLDNLSAFRQQLKDGLNLRSYEYVVVQISNDDGSTVDSPVSIRASFISDFGNILPQRLQQLAQTITNSHSKNLGLDNSVFGKVKSVSLSTYLKRSLNPHPSPAPTPMLHDLAEPPISPSIPPAHSPCGDSLAPIESPLFDPHHNLPPVYSPSRRPSVSPTPSPSRSSQRPYLSPVSPNMPPVGSPLPHGPTPKEGAIYQNLAPSLSAISPTSSAAIPFCSSWWLGISGLVIHHFLY